MVQLLEDFDLADGRDRELRRIQNRSKRRRHEKKKDTSRKQHQDTYALALVVHADLLERDDLLRLRLLCHVHLPRNNKQSGGIGPTHRRFAGLKNGMGVPVDAYPYVPSPICSSFSKQSTLREPHDGDSSTLSCPGAGAAMASGALPLLRVRVWRGR